MADISCRMGLDIGGTFTDLTVEDDDGHVRIAKVLTTPEEQERGVFDVMAAAGVPASAVTDLVHGTTLVINSLLERRGARVALVTTSGFRDILEIGRGSRPQIFNVHYRRDPVLVPRELRFVVAERTSPTGVPELEPDGRELATLVDRLRDTGVDAVAVGFLNSYRGPDNERLVADHLRRALPGVFVTASSDLSRDWREYERFNSSVANAYVGPSIERYLDAVGQQLEEQGFQGAINLLDSNGGALPVHTGRRFPLRMIESGPVGGALGAAAVGKELGKSNLVTFDMGGTTAKTCLVEHGSFESSDVYWVGGYDTGLPLQVPSLDILEVGAGGGSIAWVDETGRLRVGPESAGAFPGPACYGRGGTRPTVTDANLYCGRLQADTFVSTIDVSSDLAEKSIEDLAGALGMTPVRLAVGMLTLANLSMAAAVRRQTLERGRDPREYTLVAFGGAGPLHACEVAQAVGIHQVLVPPAPGVFSARGMLQAPHRLDRKGVFAEDLRTTDPEALTEIATQARDELVIELGPEVRARGPLQSRLALGLRYRGQEHSLLVDAGVNADFRVTRQLLEAAASRFAATYQQRFGHSDDEDRIEVVAYTVTVQVDRAPSPARRAPTSTHRDVRSIRLLYDPAQGEIDALSVPRESLAADETLSGPAVIYEYGSSTFLPPGALATLGVDGSLLLDLSDMEAGLTK